MIIEWRERERREKKCFFSIGFELAIGLFGKPAVIRMAWWERKEQFAIIDLVLIALYWCSDLVIEFSLSASFSVRKEKKTERKIDRSALFYRMKLRWREYSIHAFNSWHPRSSSLRRRENHESSPCRLPIFLGISHRVVLFLLLLLLLPRLFFLIILCHEQCQKKKI